MSGGERVTFCIVGMFLEGRADDAQSSGLDGTAVGNGDTSVHQGKADELRKKKEREKQESCADGCWEYRKKN